jgi:MFS family permease
VRADFPFRPASLPFFYGWVILAVSTLGIAMSIPGQTMGVSVFTDHLIAATGLSRLEISNAYLVGTIASGLLLPYGGTLVDRLGVRRIVLAACLGLAITLVFLASSDRVARTVADGVPGLPVGLAGWAALALGFTGIRFCGQGMLTLVSRTMLGRWFERRRGLVSAVSGPFVSFAFASAPLLLSLWIARVGWRGAWIEMAVVVGVGMGGLGWLLFRDSPEECGLRMDGDGAPAALDRGTTVPPPRDFTRAEALRTAAFWLVTLGIGSQALVGTGITFHIVDLGAEAGLSEASAVSIFLPMAVVSTLVGLAAGAAIDRFAVRYLMMFMMAGQAVMFFGMAHQDQPALRLAAILGWGIAGGCYGPLTVAALPGFFGRTHLGAIHGVMMMCLVIASALGPSALAGFKAAFGSYTPGLYAMIALPLGVFVAAPFTGDPRQRSDPGGATSEAPPHS